MSFLDSLENNLKTMESRDEAAQRDQDERKRREAEQANAQASAPYAEQLRTGPFTTGLLNEAMRIGHGMRTKVHLAWLGPKLRLEARDKKLELRPTPDGIVPAFIEGNVDTRTERIDLAGDPAVLAREWLQ